MIFRTSRLVGYGFVPWRVLDDGEKKLHQKVASTLIEEKPISASFERYNLRRLSDFYFHKIDMKVRICWFSIRT